MRARFDVAFEEFPSDQGIALALICLIEDEAAVKSALAENGWSLCQFSFDATAGSLLEADRKRLEETEARLKDILIESLSYQRYRLEFATLYDFLGTDAEKIRGRARICQDGQRLRAGGLGSRGKIGGDCGQDKVRNRQRSDLFWKSRPTTIIPPTLLDNRT